MFNKAFHLPYCGINFTMVYCKLHCKMYSYGPPHMAGQKLDDKHEHTYSSYVRIRDVAPKTYQRRWTIGKSGERGSGISVLAARHDDDDDALQDHVLNQASILRKRSYKTYISPNWKKNLLLYYSNIDRNSASIKTFFHLLILYAFASILLL